MNTKQNRNGLPTSLIEEKRFFKLYGSDKNNTPKGWNDSNIWKELEDIPEEDYFGFAITNSNYLFVDFDHVAKDGKLMPEAKEVIKKLESIGKTYMERSFSKEGLHLLVDLGEFAECFDPISNDDEHIILFPPMTYEKYKALDDKEKSKTPKIELFFNTGGRYIYLTGDNSKVNEVATGATAAEYFRQLLKLVDACHDSSGKDNTKAKAEKAVKSITKTQLEEIIEALEFIPSDSYETWIHVGMACYNSGVPFEIWDKWSQKSSKYNDGNGDNSTEKKWDSFKKNRSNWNEGTIFKLAIENGWNKAPIEKKRFNIQPIQGRELQKRDIPKTQYAVDDIFPEGYAVFSAPFKSGKSWFMLEAALAVASGCDFLGQKTTKGKAFYFALEDNEKSGQERLNMVMKGEEAPEGFYYVINPRYDPKKTDKKQEVVPTLDNGFLDYLDQLNEEYDDIKLIIVDVLGMIEYEPRAHESAYKHDYRTGTALKRWADSHEISLVVITHTTKNAHDDVFMNTTGTNGVTGAADSIITLIKEKRDDKAAVLAVTGRKVKTQYMKIHFDDECIWHFDGMTTLEGTKENKAQREAAERLELYRGSKIRQAVLAIAKKGTIDLRATAIKDKARDEHGIYLLETAGDIGKFLHTYQSYFMEVDGVEVQIMSNGTGAKSYRLKCWQEVSNDEVKTINQIFENKDT